MIVLAYLAYGAYLAIIIGGSLMAVMSASLVRALVGLIGTLLGVAGMYLLLQSPFLAFMQLLIYVGAVCVLIFFALMLADARSENGEEDAPAASGAGRLLRSLLCAVLPLLLLAPPIFVHPASTSMVPASVPLAEIGRGLMEEYVLPFELISIILLVSMAGGVFLAWDRRKK